MAHKWQTPFDPESAIADDAKKTHAVHMALLPRGALGTVLYFSGNRWDGGNHDAGLVDHSALMDYQSRTAVLPGSPTGPGGLAPNNFLDLFCCGHAMMADGRPLTAGGTSLMEIDPNSNNPHFGHWGGLREAFIFDATQTPSWQTAALMNPSPLAGANGQGGGRWYPSAVALADGTILALQGHPRIYPQQYDEDANPADWPPVEDDPRHVNSSPDRYYPNADLWTQLNPATGLGEGFLHDYAVFFPRVHVLPSGKLLIVQPLYTTAANGSIDQSGQFAGKSLIYDPDAQSVVAAFAGPQTIDGGYLITDTRAQFTSSVLLPLTPENNYVPTVLVCNQVQAARATLTPGQESNSTWTPTKARTAFFTQTDQNAQNPQQVVPPRLNAIAILLPNGQVFVSGGMNQYLQNPPAGKTYDQAFGVLVPEIYDPPTDSWTALTDAPATVPRGYHSNALLMLDGRVLTAGSETNNVFGAQSAEYRMEVFEPDYIAAQNRMTIGNAPPCVAYGETFEVDFQVAAGGSPNVSRVAIMRFGSATHGFDYDQRHVGLKFTQSAGKLNVVGPPNGGVAPPGYYMLWLIDNNALPCVQARIIRVGSQRVYVETDRSVFSIYDVQLNEDPATHVATYSRAVALVFDGFIPNEILNLTASGAVTGGNGVNVGFSMPAPGQPNPAMELLNSPQLIQRTIFAFDVVFDDVNAAFNGLSGPDDIRTLTIKLTAGTWSATATIDLVMEPSPFMTDGQPFYLSQDIRVFQITEAMAGAWLPNLPSYTWAGPTDFVQKLIAHLNAPSDNGQALFAQLPPGEQESKLSLLPTTDGTANGPKIYNFALARVRLDSANVAAKNTRVLFRLFRTMRPSLVYNTSTIYRRQPTSGTDVIGLLGVEGNDLISIPFFASDRVTPAHDMVTQPDTANLIDLPNGATEQVRFFGCWLDINQPGVGQFPASPGLATDFSMVQPADLRSIHALIGSFHQCVVAEVHYQFDANSPKLPHEGDSPSTSDKLSQRNLALVGAMNPGNAATRTVWQSFEVKGPEDVAGAVIATGVGAVDTDRAAVRQNAAVEALVLWWGNLPAGTVADVYLPGVRARDVLALTPPAHAPVWRILDEHTLRCPVPGHVAFLPLPRAIRGRALSGLLTLRLPRGIRHGQTFRCVGQHYTRAGRIAGAFQVSVKVSADHQSLIVDDKDQLAILKYNFGLMRPADRWRPVQQRIITLLAERLEGSDIDPDTVQPSPWGAGPHKPVIGGPPGRAGGGDDDRSNAVIFKGEVILPAGTELDIAVDAKIRLRAKDGD